MQFLFKVSNASQLGDTFARESSLTPTPQTVLCYHAQTWLKGEKTVSVSSISSTQAEAHTHTHTHVLSSLMGNSSTRRDLTNSHLVAR